MQIKHTYSVGWKPARDNGKLTFMAEISLNSRFSVDGGDFDLSRMTRQEGRVGGGPRRS